jgi:hypothetical protein
MITQTGLFHQGEKSFLDSPFKAYSPSHPRSYYKGIQNLFTMIKLKRDLEEGRFYGVSISDLNQINRSQILPIYIFKFNIFK